MEYLWVILIMKRRIDQRSRRCEPYLAVFIGLMSPMRTFDTCSTQFTIEFGAIRVTFSWQSLSLGGPVLLASSDPARGPSSHGDRGKLGVSARARAWAVQTCNCRTVNSGQLNDSGNQGICADPRKER